MICQRCDGKTKVYDVRPVDGSEGRVLYRRRKCLKCEYKFITFEESHNRRRAK